MSHHRPLVSVSEVTFPWLSAAGKCYACYQLCCWGNGEHMQFGWLTLALSPSPEEDATRIGQQIDQVCTAEALGFSDVWLTEHYFTGESVYNDSLMFAAALAMKTSRIRIGFAVVQTP